MVWSSLKTTLSAKPLILAGPMLRKVTESSVTVWLALKEKADVTLDIYPDDAQVVDILFSGKRSTVHVGHNLHIVAVTARRGSKPALTAGTVYYYDLNFLTAAGSVALPAAVGSGGKQIYAYGAKRLPGFSLPPDDLEQVRLLQGSCRKPNADGPDALAMLDDIIQASVDSPSGRPHQLLLTGDQIYADEVADVLLLMLTDAARTLMGDPEVLPFPGDAGSIAEMQLPTSRTDSIKDVAKLTTDDTRSHLMSLGEYIAMYLFVWSDVLWPADLPDYSDLVTALKDNRDALGRLPYLANEVTIQRMNVDVMRKTIPKVRRALANVPVAMILDDHEITDDWNMTQEFCTNVYGNVLGMRIMQNGLAAYAFCQHWGNAPEQFEKNPQATGSNPAGTEFLHFFDTAAKYDDIADEPFIKSALGLHPPLQLAAQRPSYALYHEAGARYQTAEGWIDSQSFLWHYTLEAKAYQVIVTDTRTWRSFPRGYKTPPDLIAEAQLAFQIGQTPPLGSRALLVVVTTNMPPGPTIRQGARDLPGLDAKYIYEDFYDSWDIERIDFARALTQLSRKFTPDAQKLHSGALVLLTGDVHSSSAQRITYSATAQAGDPAGAATKAEISIAQFVGSALHNQAAKTLGQHNRGYGYVPSSYKYGIDIANALSQSIMLTEGFVGWNPVTTAQWDKVGVYNWHDKLTKGGDRDLPFITDHAIRTLRDEELPHIWEKKLVSITKTPDMRIRLDYLKIADSGGYNHEPKVIEPSDPFTESADRARAYESYVHSVRQGREMVGMNNIGEITFIRHPSSYVNAKLMVRYMVHWFDKSQVQFVRYDVSLDVGDTGFPQLPYPT